MSYRYISVGVQGKGVYIIEWHGGEEWAMLNGQGGATNETSSSHFIVYDLDTGKYVDTIDLGIPREAEFASYQDGKFYVGCNSIKWNGRELYEVEIAPKK